jgi:hypothetical protein
LPREAKAGIDFVEQGVLVVIHCLLGVDGSYIQIVGATDAD